MKGAGGAGGAMHGNNGCMSHRAPRLRFGGYCCSMRVGWSRVEAGLRCSASCHSCVACPSRNQWMGMGTPALLAVPWESWLAARGKCGNIRKAHRRAGTAAEPPTGRQHVLEGAYCSFLGSFRSNVFSTSSCEVKAMVQHQGNARNKNSGGAYLYHGCVAVLLHVAHDFDCDIVAVSSVPALQDTPEGPLPHLAQHFVYTCRGVSVRSPCCGAAIDLTS
jgi:hypothetical protein